jgi:hypothetical protein
MKKNRVILSVFGVAVCATLFSGCASSGLLASAYVTNVELSKGNYKIVCTSVMGEASSEYLFGASFGAGIFTQTFALIPLTKERQHYKMAMQDLWKNFEAKNGSPIGKKLALVNIRYDSESLNVLVYTSPKVTIIAEVVEFTD